MVVLVLLLIPSYGLLVLVPRGVVWFMRCETGLFCLGHLVFGIRNGLVFLHLLSVLRTLLIGLIQLDSWLNGCHFQVVFTGLLVVWILVLVVFLIWSCSLFMSFGLVRGSLWGKLILVFFDQGVQHQCRLFLFGPGIDIWRSCRFIGALMRSLCLLPGGAW